MAYPSKTDQTNTLKDMRPPVQLHAHATPLTLAAANAHSTVFTTKNPWDLINGNESNADNLRAIRVPNAEIFAHITMFGRSGGAVSFSTNPSFIAYGLFEIDFKGLREADVSNYPATDSMKGTAAGTLGTLGGPNGQIWLPLPRADDVTKVIHEIDRTQIFTADDDATNNYFHAGPVTVRVHGAKRILVVPYATGTPTNVTDSVLLAHFSN